MTRHPSQGRNPFHGAKMTPQERDDAILEQRTMRSNDPLETEHLYLGTSITGDYPVLVPEELVRRHTHILGGTGSGKTSAAVIRLRVESLLRGENDAAGT